MDTAPIAALVTDLQAVEGLRAATELGQLDVPGVLVVVRGHANDRLGGATWQLQLICVAPDLGPDRSLAQLAETYDLLMTVVEPFGDTTVVTVAHPDGPPLPGLSLPYELPY